MRSSRPQPIGARQSSRCSWRDSRRNRTCRPSSLRWKRSHSINWIQIQSRRPAYSNWIQIQSQRPAYSNWIQIQLRGAAQRSPRTFKEISPSRFALHCTVTQETRDTIERLLALMSHRIRSGDLGEVIGHACKALIKVVERERFAVTSRPRAKGARPDSQDPTHIPADVARAVYKRDGGRCTFTSKCGERCGERRFLQIDHIVPRARGGKPTLDNLRLLCGPHNQHEADRTLGADFMDAKRTQAKTNAAMNRERREAKHDTAPAKAATSSSGRAVVDEPVAKPTAPPPPFEHELVDDDVAKPTTPPTFERELVEALTSLGYTSAEARRAVLNIADSVELTFEGRLRAALVSLSRSRPIRCSDGAFDLTAGFGLWFALRTADAAVS